MRLFALYSEYLDCYHIQTSSSQHLGSLQYDDEVDVVSYACDPSLSSRFAPVVEEDEWSPFRDSSGHEQENSGTHYVQW